MQVGRYKCHLKSLLEADSQSTVTSENINTIFFCKKKKPSFIKSGILQPCNSFPKTMHENEKNTCGRSFQ